MKAENLNVPDGAPEKQILKNIEIEKCNIFKLLLLFLVEESEVSPESAGGGQGAVGFETRAFAWIKSCVAKPSAKRKKTMAFCFSVL